MGSNDLITIVYVSPDGTHTIYIERFDDGWYVVELWQRDGVGERGSRGPYTDERAADVVATRLAERRTEADAM